MTHTGHSELTIFSSGYINLNGVCNMAPTPGLCILFLT